MSLRRAILLVAASALAAVAQQDYIPMGGVPPVARSPLTRDEAGALEQRLVSSPEDISARAQLLTFYYYRYDQDSDQHRREARLRHIGWMIEHHPDNEILGKPEAAIDSFQGPLVRDALGDPEGRQKIADLWRSVSADAKASSAALCHAAYFFRLSDKPFAAQLLERLRRAGPDREAAILLGDVYALAMMGVVRSDSGGMPLEFDAGEMRSAFAKTAKQRIEDSRDANLIGSAGATLNVIGFWAAAARKIDFDAMELAERYLQRAHALDRSNPFWAKSLLLLSSQKTMLTPTADSFRQQLTREEVAIRTRQGEEHFTLTVDLIRIAFNAGDYAKAERYANGALADARKFTNSWAYGNAIFDANTALGLIALERNDVVGAIAYLRKSAQTPGSPQLNSFGPSTALARQLLDRGERPAVLEFLETCKTFWKMPEGRLDEMIKTIQGGGVPERFGTAADYLIPPR